MATQAVTPDDESVILQLSEPLPDASSLERVRLLIIDIASDCHRG